MTNGPFKLHTFNSEKSYLKRLYVSDCCWEWGDTESTIFQNMTSAATCQSNLIAICNSLKGISILIWWFDPSAFPDLFNADLDINPNKSTSTKDKHVILWGHLWDNPLVLICNPILSSSQLPPWSRLHLYSPPRRLSPWQYAFCSTLLPSRHRVTAAKQIFPMTREKKTAFPKAVPLNPHVVLEAAFGALVVTMGLATFLGASIRKTMTAAPPAHFQVLAVMKTIFRERSVWTAFPVNPPMKCTAAAETVPGVLGKRMALPRGATFQVYPVQVATTWLGSPFR